MLKEDTKNIQEDDELCPKCGELLSYELENNGFSEPDPTHYETRFFCKNCGYEE